MTARWTTFSICRIVSPSKWRARSSRRSVSPRSNGRGASARRTWAAYDYTMRAMPHVWALEKDESAKAIDLLEKALAIDPDYPLALSLAGWCHAQRSVYNWADDIAEAQAKARSLAERAAELSGDDPTILAVLGAIHTFVRNYGTARILLDRALALDPNAAWAWQRLGWVENYTDRPKEAHRAFRARDPAQPARSDEFQQLCRHGRSSRIAGAIRSGGRSAPARTGGAAQCQMDLSKLDLVALGWGADGRSANGLCGDDARLPRPDG